MNYLKVGCFVVNIYLKLQNVKDSGLIRIFNW